MNLEAVKKELKRTLKNILLGLLALAIFAPIYLWVAQRHTNGVAERIQNKIATPKGSSEEAPKK